MASDLCSKRIKVPVDGRKTSASNNKRFFQREARMKILSLDGLKCRRNDEDINSMHIGSEQLLAWRAQRAFTGEGVITRYSSKQ